MARHRRPTGQATSGRNLSYRAAARRPCRFLSILWTDSFSHARLSWRRVLYLSDSLLPWIYQSYHPGGLGATEM
eukprot:5552326-Pleurochrysis_carterae.AAC.1